jgi:rubrerythrin
MINLKSIQTEIDASFLYALLAEHEEDENVAKVFVQMSAIELSHWTNFQVLLGGQRPWRVSVKFSVTTMS